MWHKPFLFVGHMLILPMLRRSKSGERKKMPLCPLCFLPSLPDDVQDTGKWEQANGLTWMWFGRPLRLAPCLLLGAGGGSLWLQKRGTCNHPSSWARSCPWGRLGVKAASASGVSVASPSRASKRIPLFIPAYEENSSPANGGGSGAAAPDPMTHRQPRGTALCLLQPWAMQCLRPPPHHVKGCARALLAA